MKKTILLLLIVSLLLCGCTAAAEPTKPAGTTPPTQGPTQPGTVPPTTSPVVTEPTAEPTEPTEEPTVPPETIPEPNFTNPLNGEKTAVPYTGRPVAVMLNNIISAMPMYGNSQADIMFEAIAEGGITRFLGVYSDISNVPKVGSVRSARKYFVDLMLGFHALYIHFGGSTEALNYLAQIKTTELDGMKAGAYVFQDKDRLNAGYASEHTWFVNGERVMQYAADKGIAMDLGTEQFFGFTFSDAVTVGEPANTVTAYFNMGGKPSSNTKYTRFVYDPETHNYVTEQYKTAFIDAGNSDTLTFSNVVVLYMKNYLQEDGYRMTLDTVGSGKGYFAANGQIVPILWSRSSPTDSFVLTLEDGSPVTFTPGHSYFGLVPLNATLEYHA